MMVFADEEHTSVARVLRLRTVKDVGSLEDRDAWITELKTLGARAPDKSNDGSVYALATPREEHHDHHHE
eukprot:COSAG02_NODE_4752_length_5025_cov_2.782988_2_plen_70_part_00